MKTFIHLLCTACLYIPFASGGMLLLQESDDPESPPTEKPMPDESAAHPGAAGSTGNQQHALVGESHHSHIRGSFRSRVQAGGFRQYQTGRGNRQDLNFGGVEDSQVQGHVRTRVVVPRGQQRQRGLMNRQHIGVGSVE